MTLEPTPSLPTHLALRLAERDTPHPHAPPGARRPARPTTHVVRRGHRSSVAAAAAGAALVALLAAGCGGADESSSTDAAGAGGDSGAAVSTGDPVPGVPEACRDAYPVAVGPADLADLALLPADLPAPPVDATLCETSSTMDDQVEIASYATDAAPADILTAYAQALEAYDAVREDTGAGETVSAVIDGTGVEVAARDGAFTVSLAAAF